jgi:hypothetical protein
MSLRISNGSSGVPDQNLDSKASQANSSPPQPDFPDFKVATPSSQHATAAPLKKTPRRKTQNHLHLIERHTKPLRGRNYLSNLPIRNFRRPSSYK